MNTAQSSRGVALIEFALVCPLILLLFFGAIETSRGISANNEGAQLAQEASVAVFHECKDKNGAALPDYTAAQANDCLQAQIDELYRSFQEKRPTSAIIATLYRRDAAGIQQFAGPKIACQPSTDPQNLFDCGAITSRIPLTRARADFGALLQQSGDWAVVVETFIKTDGAIEKALNPTKLEGQIYYAAAIL